MAAHTLSRRTLLRGAGAVVGLPWLEAMTPARAAGAAAGGPPLRVGWVYFPNGMVRTGWWPKGEGRDFEFNRTNAPLAAVRDHVTLISKLAHDKARPNGDGGGDHARDGAAFLTGAQARKSEGKHVHLGVSIDQVIASRVGRETRLPSIELGIEPTQREGRCDGGYSCIYLSNISWRSPTQPSGIEISPRRAFDRLFGATGAEAEKFKARSADRTSVLDFVADERQSLVRRLGETDRRKLDEYFDSVREVERQIDHMASLKTIDLPPGSRPEADPAEVVSHIRLMYGLMALAWRTDATRVATFMLANAQTNRVYGHLGITSGHHQLTHSSGQEAEIEKIDLFIIEEFTRFLVTLRDIPEGDGCLLDNCLVTLGGAMGDGRHHDHGDLPIVVAGKARGAVSSGRRIRLVEETPMTNLFVTTAQLAGVEIEQFGDSTGGLPQLLEG